MPTPRMCPRPKNLNNVFVLDNIVLITRVTTEIRSIQYIKQESAQVLVRTVHAFINRTDKKKIPKARCTKKVGNKKQPFPQSLAHVLI